MSILERVKAAESTTENSHIEQLRSRLSSLADAFEKHAARLEGLTDKLIGSPKSAEGKALMREAAVGGLINDLSVEVDRLERLSDRIFDVGARLDGTI
jgi:hypothetical protein